MSEREIRYLPTGFQAAGIAAGIKERGSDRLDLGLLLADEAYPAACLFTKNALQGAHIPVCREHLKRSGGLVRAILVNAGNANCATGAEGIDDAFACAEKVAEEIGCPTEQVLPMSTGVIGARLPLDRILDAIPGLVHRAATNGADDFARAILTTDTRPKIVATRYLDGDLQITGIAKGSGMIHPDMATMLAFLLTDARLVEPLDTLRSVADQSFHCLSVDGDTSPNDSVVLWGSGTGSCPPDRLTRPLTRAAQELCQLIASDGEGASRTILIEVSGAASDDEARQAAATIATSPLVKTAIAGRDPNWGRIVSAVGRSGVSVDLAKASLNIGTARLFENGRPLPENEAAASKWLNSEPDHSYPDILCDLGVGDGLCRYWTCDLTADYVRINADYRS